MAKGKRRKPRGPSVGGAGQRGSGSSGSAALPSRTPGNKELPNTAAWQDPTFHENLMASQPLMPGPMPLLPQFNIGQTMPMIPFMPMFSGAMPGPMLYNQNTPLAPDFTPFQQDPAPLMQQQLPLRPQSATQLPQSNGVTPNADQASSSKKNKILTRDAIVPPSKESGGVPDPSPSYLARASFLPQRTAASKPLLVVIDLNGTLLHRPNRASPSKFVARPHAAAFLSYCIRTFWVVIWSSARPANVRSMCARLIPEPELSGRVVAVWGRDRFGLSADDFNRRVQCYKRLTRVWEDDVVARSHPAYAQGGRWTQGNTVLVDDSIEKARSEPHNLLQIPEFAGDVNEKPEILPQVHDYLNELCFQSDVSTYIRKYPYKPGPEGWTPETPP